MPRGMRGISPVIATVIILAVTIAIAIAVVGWVMGLFRASSKGSVQIKVLPDSYIDTASNTSFIHVKDVGSVSAKITKIVVSGLNCNFINATVGSTTYTSLPISIGPGEDAQIYLNCTNATPGVTYSVYVYTADGSVFPGQVPAQ